MTFRAVFCSAALISLLSTVATAGPVVDAAARAEALQAEGKTVEALEALDAAVDAIWKSAPLSFRRVLLVESAAEGLPPVERTNRSFRPDEKLFVHLEPVGFGTGAGGAGFTGDLAIENSTGQILTEAKDLFSVSVDLPPGRRELDMTLAFVVPYIRPGDYVARFTLRDRNSDKSGIFEVPFTVTAPAAENPASAEADEPVSPSAAAGGQSPQP